MALCLSYSAEVAPLCLCTIGPLQPAMFHWILFCGIPLIRRSYTRISPRQASLVAAPLTRLSSLQDIDSKSPGSKLPATMSGPSNAPTTPGTDLTSMSQARIICELSNIESLHIKEIRALKADHVLHISRLCSQNDARTAVTEAAHRRTTHALEAHLQDREQEVFDLLTRSEYDTKQHHQDINALRQRNLKLRAEQERICKDMKKEVDRRVAQCVTAAVRQRDDDIVGLEWELAKCRAESEVRRMKLERLNALFERVGVKVKDSLEGIAGIKEALESESVGLGHGEIDGGSTVNEPLIGLANVAGKRAPSVPTSGDLGSSRTSTQRRRNSH